MWPARHRQKKRRAQRSAPSRWAAAGSHLSRPSCAAGCAAPWPRASSCWPRARSTATVWSAAAPAPPRLLLTRRARNASGTPTQCTRRNDSPPPPPPSALSATCPPRPAEREATMRATQRGRGGEGRRERGRERRGQCWGGRRASRAARATCARAACMQQRQGAPPYLHVRPQRRLAARAALAAGGQPRHQPVHLVHGSIPLLISLPPARPP
jgi:hypothetical protein